jgi:hypothetical protein
MCNVRCVENVLELYAGVTGVRVGSGQIMHETVPLKVCKIN